MSIEIGFQGNRFNKKVIKRVEQLREIGYHKKISLDGGVNLKTANLIKGLKIDRVSVGSFFVRSKNIIKDKLKLEKALN